METKHNMSKYKTGCRCDQCKAANAKAQREYQARKKARLHQREQAQRVDSI